MTADQILASNTLRISISHQCHLHHYHQHHHHSSSLALTWLQKQLVFFVFQDAMSYTTTLAIMLLQSYLSVVSLISYKSDVLQPDYLNVSFFVASLLFSLCFVSNLQIFPNHYSLLHCKKLEPVAHLMILFCLVLSCAQLCSITLLQAMMSNHSLLCCFLRYCHLPKIIIQILS